MYKITNKRWNNSDIQKNERINAGNEYDEKSAVMIAAMKCYVYSRKTKKKLTENPVYTVTKNKWRNVY